MSWTDERVATLSKLWADGLSASQIAAELGGVTRNAVIGKVHRLGLSGRAKPANTSSKRPKAIRRSYNAKPRSAGRDTLPARANTGIPARTVITDIEKPEPLKLQLVDLTEKTCKWPYGDPATDDFFFCGHPTKEDSPYCDYCSRLAYQQASDRRREKQNSSAAA